MTIMAGSYALSTHREAGLLGHSHERAKALALADGAIYYTMYMLNLPDMKARWRADGTVYRWLVDGATVRIRIFDESGKVDINTSQESTLKTVINLALQNQQLAVQLADAIMDWRDGDDLKRNNGAEAAEYDAAGSKQKPQNRNFLMLEELRSVLGLKPDIYRRLEPWLTIYTGQDGLNPARASREILLGLFGGDQSIVNAFIEQRAMGAAAPLPPVPGIRFNADIDHAYTVLAEAEIEGQTGAGLKAIIKRGQGADGGPFMFLDWKPRITPVKHPEPK